MLFLTFPQRSPSYIPMRTFFMTVSRDTFFTLFWVKSLFCGSKDLQGQIVVRTLFDFKKFSLPNKTTLIEAKCSKWSKDYIPGHHSLQLPITKSGCQQNVKTVIPEKRYFWRRLKSFDKLTTHEVEVSLEKIFTKEY